MSRTAMSMTESERRREAIAKLVRRVQAARSLAVDPTLDPVRHDAAVTAVGRGEQALYIQFGVRIPMVTLLPALLLV